MRWEQSTDRWHHTYKIQARSWRHQVKKADSERQRERESNTPSTSDALPVYQLRLSRCRQRERGGSRGGGRKEKKSRGTISFFSFAPPVPIHPFPPTGTERGEGAPGLRYGHTHTHKHTLCDHSNICAQTERTERRRTHTQTTEDHRLQHTGEFGPDVRRLLSHCEASCVACVLKFSVSAPWVCLQRAGEAQPWVLLPRVRWMGFPVKLWRRFTGCAWGLAALVVHD